MTDAPNAKPKPSTVRVWDPVVRIGHWTLVIGFFTAYLSGDEWLTGHVWAGYAVAAVVGFRVIWGIFGTRHARFTNFVRGPKAVMAYMSGLRSGKAKRHLGHNPAGGAMIIALLFSLSVTTVSGMALLAVEEGQGPLAGVVAAQSHTPAINLSVSYERRDHDDEDENEDHERGENSQRNNDSAEEVFETVHSAFTYLTLALVALHILGVIVSSMAHKENLVRAMITGRKREESSDDAAV